MDDGKPLFLQIAELIESSIIDGSLQEEAKAPSTNELATFHRINPATAAKGINHLVTGGVLYKKRGIGMFVSPGARNTIKSRRREQFAENYIDPLIAEARKLGITASDLQILIQQREERHDQQ
ncbi:GntR family transcriptional regulator [Hoyosella rhizosphaerae]|uniref:GntR family transcriptional regulator n=1 Tax=Hoyosella rhizosphaerae TaxID=1755582 RepID=A0A916U6Q9_9ACTN|nr:GntR family transcriptional regulator [Hoyosella rhizosphaerae]MBN4926274.1 GntR family transcriptional regulator [Hoyosella rhizosphaerae]GGC60689.1 GntR family transcriptional regulator [Hoyosella rhizosphaerae]